jgi:NAD(P)-dependent dehydrogenase (short-subunit alcohol dehydrogenase family)
MRRMGLLDGRVAIITGGEGSIGMATAREFSEAGCSVFLAGVDEPGLRSGAAALGPACVGWSVADVRDSDQVKAAVAAAVAVTGRLDVVVAGAGISGAIALVSDYPEDVFDDVLAVHVRGTFLLCKHALPYLSDGASIVIVSSVVGLTSDPGIAGYATAKHAQVGLMRTLAKELAPRGIRVNTLHPGPVDNEFQRRIEVAATGLSAASAAAVFDSNIALGRHASPQEVARSALFLASDASSFVTGITLPVDGGMSI